MTASGGAVTAFVVRGRAPRAELLVLRAPEGDLRLLGGDARPGERAEEAILRLIAAATGLEDVEIVERLGGSRRGGALVRDFFLCAWRRATPLAWDRTAPAGETTNCFWVPLQPTPALASPQDRWLRRFAGRIAEAAGLAHDAAL